MCTQVPAVEQDIFATFDIGSSLLHKTAPIIKIIAALIWTVIIALLHNLSIALFCLGGSLLLLIIAKLPWRAVAKRLLTVNIFILFMWCMLPFSFSTPGVVIFNSGPLAVTYEGIMLATLLTLKANGIIFAIIALLSTTSLHALAMAMRKLRVPEKLVTLLLLTIRYFYVIYAEFSRLRNAMKMRIFKPSALKMHTYTTYANLIGILLVRSIGRAERIHHAMLCRGYNGTFHSISDSPSFSKYDGYFIGLMSLLIISVGLLS